jgi:hypothetical protein
MLKRFSSSSFQEHYNSKYHKTSSFPYTIIDGLAGEFTETYCSRLEVPPEFMYMSFLTCLGSMLSKSLTITTEIRPQPRLYILLLGGSAEERKSTAIKESLKFFDYALKRGGLPQQSQSQQQQPSQQASPAKSVPRLLSSLSLKLNTCLGVGSAEGLAKKLQNNSLLLCYDEFKAFVSKAKIRNSTLLQCVNSLFESNSYENQTSKAGIVIENGSLSLLAASTVQTYESAWDSSFTAIGFNNRLFIVPGTAQREYSIPPEIPIADKNQLADKLYQILGFVGKGRKLNITTGARELYHNWYMNRPFSIHSKRLDGYALRFMELLAVNRMANVIDENIVNNAIELMDWEFEMRQLYDPIDADNTIAKMEEKIRRALSRKDKQTGKAITGLSDRKLKQTTNANRTGLYFYALGLKNLQKAEEIAFDGKTRLWSSVSDNECENGG